MHYAPTEILQTYENDNRKAEVHFVDGEKNTKFRTVCYLRTSEDSKWRVVSPDYHATERQAEFRARRWTFAQSKTP